MWLEVQGRMVQIHPVRGKRRKYLSWNICWLKKQKAISGQGGMTGYEETVNVGGISQGQLAKEPHRSCVGGETSLEATSRTHLHWEH